jgi:hypothetical protein
LKSLFSSIREKITQYLQLRFEEIRLEIIERLVMVMGYFSFIIVAAFLFFFAFIFMGFGLAAWLGELLNSRSAGFFITGGLVLIIGVVIVCTSRYVIRFFAGKMIVLLTKPRKKEEEEEETQE